MICYTLNCDSGHRFEGWFRNSEAYSAQAAAGEVGCPVCGSVSISKALMAPAIGRGEIAQPALQAAPAAPGAPAAPHALAADPRAKALLEAVKRLRQHVSENAAYVGSRFPEEARRIHYEETEHRNIYGEASIEDAKALLEEGIEIQPLPSLPDDQN